ncbi:MAG TPA: ABC transporter substrate-binding protein [Methanospirillum sp.]|nr:ABC transporter substrate-binding protein [Methanospirillum sp.]
MNQYPTFFTTLILIGLLSLGLVSAETNQSFLPEGNPHTPAFLNNGTQIPVGILVMKSGFVSDIGTEYLRAFDMVQQANPESRIRPVIIDAGSNASIASSAWMNMKNTTPYLPIVVTVASWTTNVVYPDTADTEIIQLALGSAVVNRSRLSDNLVRFTPGVEQESPILASYLSQYSRIVVIGGDNDLTNGYFSAFDTLLPGKIQLHAYYNPNDIDSTLNITEIIQKDPDVIVLLSASEGGRVAELLRDAGITAQLVGTRVIERNSLAETNATEGLIFTTPALNMSHPFFQRYFDMYGEDATFYGAEGFDALTNLYSVGSACKKSSDCIYSGFKDKTYTGALGTVRFDEKGVATYPITLKIVHDGIFEDYSGNFSVIS